MAKMTQKEIIIALREEGFSYQEIAKIAGCTVDFARTVWSRASRMQKPEEHSDGVCKFCGKKLEGTKVTKPRQFCDDKCCDAYFNERKAHKPYILICELCGKEFISFGAPKKRFCGRDCQTEAAREKKYGNAA